MKNVYDDQRLPEGIEENVPFDGSLLQDKGFEAGRTYIIGPVIPCLRPLIMYPSREDDVCFEDALFTCRLMRSDFTVLPLESYYDPREFNPVTTDWLAEDENSKKR